MKNMDNKCFKNVQKTVSSSYLPRSSSKQKSLVNTVVMRVCGILKGLLITIDNSRLRAIILLLSDLLVGE